MKHITVVVLSVLLCACREQTPHVLTVVEDTTGQALRIVRQKHRLDSVYADMNHKSDSIANTPAAKAQKKASAKWYKLVNKYGCTLDQARSISNSSVSVGMNKAMCIAAWGQA